MYFQLHLLSILLVLSSECNMFRSSGIAFICTYSIMFVSLLCMFLTMENKM